MRLAQRTDLDVTRVIGLAAAAVRCSSIDEIRRRGREQRALQRMPDTGHSEAPESSVCSTAAAQSILRRSAQHLSRAELRVLCLVADGESHSAISEKLGITVRASEVALSRARGKLRRAGRPALCVEPADIRAPSLAMTTGRTTR